MMSILGVIPARYQSTRLPGKPLVSIAGKPMVQRVWEQVCKAQLVSKIVVATDDKRIFAAVQSFGGEAVMTDPAHPSGTDRIIEVAHKWPDFEAYINIQGDEPLIDPQQIDQVAALLGDPGAYVATLVKKLDLATELHNPNTAKVVRDIQGRAIYFSRSPIPFLRDEDAEKWHARKGFFKHIGMYGYRKEALSLIEGMSRGLLEQAESLEQLRWLENGLPIVVGETELESHGVDVPADIAKVEALIPSRR